MDQPFLSEKARQAYHAALLHDNLLAMRRQYCELVNDKLRQVSGWLLIDSWLGGGKVEDVRDFTTQGDEDSHDSFLGTAYVVEMASELIDGCVTSLGSKNYYVAAVLVRQLLECEYLLAVFADDISVASTWGGHPAPQGVFLIRSSSRRGELQSATMWSDLAQHLRRIWTSIDSILSEHHARYTIVQSSEIRSIAEMDQQWTMRDPLASPLRSQILEDLVARTSTD